MIEKHKSELEEKELKATSRGEKKGNQGRSRRRSKNDEN